MLNLKVNTKSYEKSSPMLARNYEEIKHLHHRAGFGISCTELKKASLRPVKNAVQNLLKGRGNAEPLQEIKENLRPPYDSKDRSEEIVKQYLRIRNQQQQNLNTAWMKRLAETEHPLQEKMTLFWHGHFACRINNAFQMQQLNNVHRKYALGNFRQMLLEVSKTPAMLSFLNNQQNKKGKPNENFARELMELFTLGRGHYTEKDIKEAARAFTGWQYDREGGFHFNERQHDSGSKIFFGKTGNFNGEDIIDIILEKKQAAYFIAERIYKFLVNDIPDPIYVKELGDHFYTSDYQIKPLLEKLFTSKWFYEKNNRGNKIKSPIEFITGLNRQFYVSYQNPKIQLLLQRSLGQILFNPPNVAGWPGGQNWIDSSTLLTRMRLPSLLLNGGVIDFGDKTDPEDEAAIAAGQFRRPAGRNFIRTQPDWDRFFQELPPNTNKAELAGFLLAPALSSSMLEKFETSSLKDMAVQLASTPEYQLC